MPPVQQHQPWPPPPQAHAAQTGASKAAPEGLSFRADRSGVLPRELEPTVGGVKLPRGQGVVADADFAEGAAAGKPVLWEANIPQPQPGSVAVLKNDGSFLVKSPSGEELWRAPVKTREPGSFFMMLGSKGRIEIYSGSGRSDPNRALVWGSEDNQASDRNGECQCHITNMDGSPGKPQEATFSVCGLQVCRSTCAAERS